MATEPKSWAHVHVNEEIQGLGASGRNPSEQQRQSPIRLWLGENVRSHNPATEVTGVNHSSSWVNGTQQAHHPTTENPIPDLNLPPPLSINFTLSPSAKENDRHERSLLSLDSKIRTEGSVSIGHVRKRRRCDMHKISKNAHSKERNNEEAEMGIVHNFHFPALELHSARNCSAANNKLPMAKEPKSWMQVTVNEGVQGSGSTPRSFEEDDRKECSPFPLCLLDWAYMQNLPNPFYLLDWAYLQNLSAPRKY